MADRDLDAFIAAQTEAMLAGVQTTEAAPPKRSVLSSLLDFGEGALNEALDFLDRPHRALMHAIRGLQGGGTDEWNQALSALVPLGQRTGLTEALGLPESKPIGFEDVLKAAGVDAGLETPLGSTRAIGGFFGDLLLDPLNIFGGAAGRLASKGLGGIGKAVRTATEAAAATELPFLRSTLAPVAKGALDVAGGLGELFVKDYGLRSLGQAGERLIQARDTAIENYYLMEKELSGRTERQLKLVAETGQKRLADLMAEPGAQDYFLATVVKPSDPEALSALMERAQAHGITERTKAAIGGLQDNEQEFLKEYMVGSPKAQWIPLPGKRGISGEVGGGAEQYYISSGMLSEAGIEDQFKRWGAEHVGHFLTTESMMQHAYDELGRIVGAKSGTGTAEIGSRARSFVAMYRDAADAQKARKILGSLDEIKQAMGEQPFETSLAKITYGEGRRFIAIKTVNDVLQAVTGDPELFRPLSKAIPTAEIPSGWRRIAVADLPKSVSSLLPEGTVDAIMQKSIANELFGTRFSRGWVARMRGDEAKNAVVRSIAKINNAFRGFTVGVPQTILRDMAGNEYLNYLGTGLASQGWHADAVGLMRDAGKEEIEGTLRVGEKVYQKQELVRQLVAKGIIGRSLVHTELGSKALDAAMDQKLGWKRFASFDPQQNLLSGPILWLKGVINDESRVTHFLAKLAETGDVNLAARSVKKYLFSSDNLTEFERGLREIIPFYSWMRGSVPVNLESIVRQPQRVAKIAGLKMRLDEQNRVDVPDEAIPTWLQGQLILPVSRSGGVLRVFSLDNWLPLADLARVESPGKFIDWLTSSVTPLLKEPLEQYFNVDTFFRRAIESYDGETENFLGMRLSTRSAHLLRNVRLLNEADRAIAGLGLYKSGQDRTRDMLSDLGVQDVIARTATGAKVRPLDLQRNKVLALRKYEREERELRGKLSFARRNGDEPSAEAVVAAIREVQKRRQIMSAWDPESHPASFAASQP